MHQDLYWVLIWLCLDLLVPLFARVQFYQVGTILAI